MSYSAELTKKLEELGAEEGYKLSVETDGKTYVGTMMPHHEFSAPDIIVLKMKSGYNVGIRVGKDTVIKVVDKPVARNKVETEIEDKKGLPKLGLPKLVLIGTGGTIASYVEKQFI